jgi:hypothetical protein
LDATASKPDPDPVAVAAAGCCRGSLSPAAAADRCRWLLIAGCCDWSLIADRRLLVADADYRSLSRVADADR